MTQQIIRAMSLEEACAEAARERASRPIKPPDTCDPVHTAARLIPCLVCRAGPGAECTKRRGAGVHASRVRRAAGRRWRLDHDLWGRLDAAPLLLEMMRVQPVRGLLCECAAMRDDGTAAAFCANWRWYERPGFKSAVESIAGSFGYAEFGTSAHYDALYGFAYQLLPNCRDCWCM